MVLPEDALRSDLASLEAQDLSRRPVGSPRGLDWITNDILGLSRDAQVIAAGQAAIQEHGAGARASRLLGGDLEPHQRAERSVADWMEAQAALLFPSGWQAAAGVMGALAGPGDVLLCDALLHASLIDGARLTRARRVVHPHGDLEALEAELRACAGARRRIIVTEGLFSMDGTTPDLIRLHALAEEHDAWLVVDEAHSAGLLGPAGRGAWAEAKLPTERLAARIVTGGKALGCAGAFAVGTEALRDLLVSRARSFLFTTGAPPSLAACLEVAVTRVQEADAARAHVLDLARALADRLALPTPAGAIVPIPVGSAAAALDLAARLRSEGHDLHAVRPPTVPEGTSRLRVVVHAGRTMADVEGLARALETAGWSAPGPSSPSARRARALWVVGTDTDAGKTVASAAVVHALSTLGEVAYWKPVQTGDVSDTEELRRLVPGLDADEPAVSLPLPASPHEAAAAASTAIDVSAVDRALDKQLARVGSARLVVEPAGGIHVPLTLHNWTSDWLARRGEELVLVARSGLGTLNHSLLTLEALRSRGLRPRALILVGPPHPSNAATLRELAGCPLFELPHLAPLDSHTVRAWAVESGLAQALA